MPNINGGITRSVKSGERKGAACVKSMLFGIIRQRILNFLSFINLTLFILNMRILYLPIFHVLIM